MGVPSLARSRQDSHGSRWTQLSKLQRPLKSQIVGSRCARLAIGFDYILSLLSNMVAIILFMCTFSRTILYRLLPPGPPRRLCALDVLEVRECMKSARDAQHTTLRPFCCPTWINKNIFVCCVEVDGDQNARFWAQQMKYFPNMAPHGTTLFVEKVNLEHVSVGVFWGFQKNEIWGSC